MTRKIKIIDVESGKELRETYTENESKFLGMGIRDVVWGILLSVSAITFCINSDTHQKTMEKTLDRLVNFKNNSDSFQSYAWGTRIVDGQPIDINYKIGNRGNLNQKGD